MTTRRQPDLNAVLGEFLGSGPSFAPDRLIQAALEEAATTPQHRPILSPWRSHMSRTVRLALAAALLLAVVAAGALYLGNQPAPLPGPTPTPGASPTTAAIASPTAAATPLVTPRATPAPPAITAASLASDALQAVENEVARGRSLQLLTQDDQDRLFQRADDLRLVLDEGSTTLWDQMFQGLKADVATRVTRLDAEGQAIVNRAMADLERLLAATPFASGEIAAGTHFSTTWQPTVIVTMPAGWSRQIEDADVLALTKGSVTFAFDRMATAVTPDALAKTLGTLAAANLAEPPVAVTVGAFSGFSGTNDGQVSLWYTAGLQVHDSAPDARILAWVLDVNGRPVAIHVDGPVAEIEALRAEISAIVSTLASF